MIPIVASGIFFACVAYIAVQTSQVVCSDVESEPDGPAPGKAPAAILVAAAAVLGGLLPALGAMPMQIGVAAIVTFALIACWVSDAACGIVPDVFTLAPLAALLLLSIVQRDWTVVTSAAIVFAPFAIAAAFSRGYGMGWGDAKLVALTGAALGAPLAIPALIVACITAVAGHRLFGVKSKPIAFAPYIAAATGLAVPLGLLR